LLFHSIQKRMSACFYIFFISNPAFPVRLCTYTTFFHTNRATARRPIECTYSTVRRGVIGHLEKLGSLRWNDPYFRETTVLYDYDRSLVAKRLIFFTSDYEPRGQWRRFRVAGERRSGGHFSWPSHLPLFVRATLLMRLQRRKR
jgi:hypothetical protein